MKEKQKEKQIQRWFDETMFENQEIKACLKKLAQYVDTPTSKWHWEFRGNASRRNAVDLYFNGNVLSIHFQKNSRFFTAIMADKLKERLIQNNIAFEGYFKGKPLETFENFIKLLPQVEEVYATYKSLQRARQEEREYECAIAKTMNSAKRAFIVDIEVVVSKTAHYCVDRKKSKKSNPEGDILVLAKMEAQYRFLPVEMKMGSAKTRVLDDASDEVKTFLNVIYGNGEGRPGFLTDFQKNYQIICKQKRELGLIKEADSEIEIVAEKPEKPVGLILILTGNGKRTTRHALTAIPEKQLQLLSEANEQYRIYGLKCDQAYFQSCAWLEQLT